MALDGLIRYLLLPELRLLEQRKSERGGSEFFAEKVSPMEVCPRCATPSRSTYDWRWVRLKTTRCAAGRPFCGCRSGASCASRVASPSPSP
jgi:hypothetical protein